MINKVSVIIPVYNVEKYINQCVDSVLSQTYSNLEIILVDDGSTDSSVKICDWYKEKDSRISVIHKKNGGLSDARNAGLKICTGDYISFLDSDDYLSSYFFEIMMNIMQDGNCDIVALKGGVSFWDGDEKPQLAKNSKDYVVRYMSAKDVQERILYQEISTGAPFKIFKRDMFEKIEFPVGYLYEDVATTYKPFFRAHKCAIVEADLYAYRKRKDSIVRQNFSRKKLICLTIFDQLVNDQQLKEIGLNRAAKARVYAMTFSVFLQVPLDDRDTQKLLWNKLKTVRRDIMFDRSKLMRKKTKYAAWISIFGMYITYHVGKKFGQRGSMG